MSSEVEYLRNKLNDTRAELEREKIKEEMETIAARYKTMYDAFVEAGFTDEQAWFFVGTFFQNLNK